MRAGGGLNPNYLLPARYPTSPYISGRCREGRYTFGAGSGFPTAYRVVLQSKYNESGRIEPQPCLNTLPTGILLIDPLSISAWKEV